MGGVGEANWENVGEQLIGSLICQAIFVSVGMILRLTTISRLNDRSSTLRQYALKYVGTEKDAPVEATFLAAGYLGQFGLSFGTCIIWVTQVYQQNVTTSMKALYVILGTFAIVHYFINALRCKFHPTYFWSASSIVDSLTIAPMMMTSSAGYAWVNLAFMRLYRASLSVERLEHVGLMKSMTEYQTALLWMCVRSLTLISLFAASIFCAEVLGPIPNCGDKFVTTDMGDISLFQMFYWVVTTISTVGYGDFSPTNMLSRALTSVCIIAGVVFFSIQTQEVVRIGNLEKAGLGWFTKTAKNHVIVCGKGVHRDSGVLISFISECLHPDRECVRILLVSDTMDEKLLLGVRNSDALKGLQCGQLSHLVGSVLQRHDQLRFGLETAEMVVVLGDPATSNPELEGEVNLLLTLAVLQARPNVPIRLMLLTPRCRRNAIAAGIPPFFCISLDEVKANLMAHSCGCPGYSTMVMNLFTSDREEFVAKADKEPWQHEYLHGASMEVYGFSSKLAALTFGQLAQDVFKNHCVLLIGCQIDGRVQLAPMQHVVEPGTVCFAVAENEKRLESIRDGSDWVETCRFRRNQRFQARDIKQVVAMWNLSEIHADSRDSHGGVKAQRPNRRTEAARALHQEFMDDSDELTSSHQSISLPQFAAMNTAASKPASQTSTPGIYQQPTRPSSLNIPSHSQNRRPSSGWIDPTVSDEVLKAITLKGSHIVLLALSDQPWPQVETFSTMINRAEPKRSIVVLFSGELPSNTSLALLVKNSVHLYEGIALEPSDLIKVGITTASAVVSLAGQPFPGVNARTADTGTAVASTLVEKIIFQETGADRFVCCEWIFPPNIGLIPRYPYSVVPTSGFRDTNLAIDTKLSLEFDLLNSVRYAAGRVITAVGCGALCAQAYFTPGVMEVFDKLVYANGEVIPFQIKLPPNEMGGSTDGERWEKIFEILLIDYGERLLPIGVLRAPCELDNSKCGFVITNPQSSMIMRSDDMVIVLAKQEFIMWYSGRMAEEGKIENTIANHFVSDGQSQREPLHSDFNPLCGKVLSPGGARVLSPEGLESRPSVTFK